MNKRLLVATHNQGKVTEYAELLQDLDVEWLSLEDAGVTVEVEETGATFRENAVLKAETYAREAGLLTLADDSGLEVDAMNGRPGVQTARFGGEDLNSEERYRLLLERLERVPWGQRGARFRCVVALATPEGGVLETAEGAVEGRIALEPAGEGGFGYDPIFYVEERGATMAELPADVKNQLSHRARAVTAIKPLLQRVLEDLP
ncbi:MAG: XTP/dITP diphosphatase [Candidatus Promineifilaceae bacterium]|nr:XTP/dITP diphosphatase [Candidatus Promineifilaceae bacterium]